MLRLKIPTVTGLSLFLAMLGIVMGTKLLNAHVYDDPFLPYAAIQPGQPRAALEGYKCTYLLPDEVLPSNWSYCQIQPESGPVLLISVIVKNQRIYRLTFQLEGVQIGHVARHWGRPDQVKQQHRYYAAYWDAGIYATATSRGWFTLQSPIQLVSIRDGE